MYWFNEFEANSVEATFHEGLDLLEADHAEEALRSFDWVIEHSPAHSEAHYYRGLTLLSLNRAREAVGAFRRAVELSPGEGGYQTYLGYALLAAGNAKEAAEELERALELDPYSAQTLLYHAAALAAAGELERARGELETVLERDPEDVDVRRHYAALLQKMGDETAVLAQCEEILKRQPHNVDALAMAAWAATRQGDHPAAIRYLRQQTILDPSNAHAWHNLVALYEAVDRPDAVGPLVTEAIENGVADARLYLARGRYYLAHHQLDKAVDDFRAALELNDRFFEAHLMMAQALAAQGRLRQALRHATLAVRLRSNDRNALLVKAELHRLLGEEEAENQCLTVIIANSPRDFGLVQRKVRNLLALGQYAEAFTTLDQYLHYRPRHSAGWLLYAEVAEKMGNEGAAWRAYRRLLGLGNVPVAGYLAYAAFLVRQHKLELAADVLQAGAAHYPAESTLQSCRAAVLQNLGRAAEARQHLQSYLESAQPSGEILWLLGRAHYMLGEYEQALEAFRQARSLVSDRHGAAAPTFPCVVAEAYTLHHLGRTNEAIRLLERTFGQYERHETEYFEALGELNEFAGNYGKALTLYARGLQREPHQAPLHYRIARVLARLHSWRAALEHLRLAVGFEPQLAINARQDKLFRPLWLMPAFHRVVGPEPLRTLMRRAGIAALAAGGVVAAAWLAWLLIGR
jgi:tetratricopeptide (TPR) repeat protein